MLKKVISVTIKKILLINLSFPIDLVDLNWREFLLLQNYSTSYANEEKKIQSQRNSFISVLQQKPKREKTKKIIFFETQCPHLIQIR